MDATLEQQFLHHSAEKLKQYTERIATSVGKLNEEQIWMRGGDNENAIGNLILHLCGNVRQWIVSGVGGQPDHRKRDEEFDARGGVPAAELIGRLRKTVDEATAVILAVSSERLSDRLVIQQYPVCVMEAIYHVVEHFSMHTGQILFITKMLSGADLGFYAHLRTTAAHGQKTP
ncbi:MAG TPA: DUF1572 family protein [Bryobacteraceae bacterium]|nr:DUF1572 family protein [Bryobacteraceae bacterium]